MPATETTAGDLEAPPAIGTAAIVGGGVIGGGWAARYLLNGIDVVVHDPDPEAEGKMDAVLRNAARALGKLTLAPPPERGRLTFADSIAETVAGAGVVHESVPEREELKIGLLNEIDAHAGADALVFSSTSGLLPSRLQSGMARPGRMMVAHPFNPVYLLPLVEVCGGARTDASEIERAAGIFAGLGMQPLVMRKEIDAFIADRLMEALWREALWLVKDGVATTAEVDDAVRYGCGLRWAQMGTFQVFQLAGGEGGMRHMLAQFGPALGWPWTKLTDVPELTDDFIETVARQCDAQADGVPIREMEAIRDDNLVAILQALKLQRDGEGWGAGATLKRYEDSLWARAEARLAGEATGLDVSAPLPLYEGTVNPSWIDYNGHMNESKYLQICTHTSDALMRMIGVDADYVAAGCSYYTVETHIMHRGEARVGEPIRSSVQVLGADEKRMHLFIRMVHGETGDELASGEQMLLHVDMNAARAAPAAPEVFAKLDAIRAAHADLPRPEAVGRHVGERR